MHFLFIFLFTLSSVLGFTIAKTNPKPVIKKGRTTSGYLDINKPFNV